MAHENGLWRKCTILWLLMQLGHIYVVASEDSNLIQRKECGNSSSALQLMIRSSDPEVIYAASDTHICKLTKDDGQVTRGSFDVATPKVLLQDPNSNNLLFCGTANSGQCQIIDRNDLTPKQSLTQHEDYAYLGGNRSSFAFFSNAGYISGENRQVLYVAHEKSYPGDDEPILSSRDLQITGGSYKIELITESDEYGYYYRQIDLEQTIRDYYPIRYVHGFVHGSFVYYITVQRQDIDPNLPFTTHLVRVCQNDDSYNSYAEIELQCSASGEIDNTRRTVHGVAEAAFLHNDNNDTALFVVFGKSNSGKAVSDKELGSVVCKFPLLGLQEKFYEIFSQCYDGRGHRLPWITDGMVGCAADDIEKRYIHDEKLDYCLSSGINRGVGYGYATVAKPLYRTTADAGFATSIVVQTQNDLEVIVLGTTQGDLHQIAIRQDHDNVVYKTTRIGGKHDNQTVARSMLLSNDSSYVYAMVGNEVISVNIASCSFYTDCVSCAQSNDPLDCGWCGGRCTTRQECTSTPFWMPNSCPPIVEKFHPIAGPTEGGTMVTIEGSHFGNWSAAPDININIGNMAQCEITEKQDNRIICKTEEFDPLTNGSVDMATLSSSGKQVSLHGSIALYSYKAVRVKTIAPLKGPKSGGTEIVITGSNLDVGSTIHITVAGLNCKINMLSGDRVTCLSMAVPNHLRNIRKRSLPEGYINITIDNAVRTSESVFVYGEDPEITNVTPLKSIVSGGTVVTVEGSFLDSVKRPHIVIETRQGTEQFMETCTPNVNGTRMYCVAPALNATLEDPLRIVTRQLRFKMDGVSELNNFPETHAELSKFEYHVDPIITEPKGDEKDLRLSSEETHLQIKGEYLNSGASIHDYNVTIGDDPCEITDLFPDKLYCALDNAKHATEKGRPKDVQVKVGFLRRVTVYYLQYQKKVEPERVTDGEASTSTIIVILLVVAVVIIAVVIASVFIFKRRKRRREATLVNTNNLTVRFTRERAERDRTHRNNNYVQRQASREEADTVELGAGVLADDTRKLLEATDLLIDRDDLQLLEEIGKGHFGCVYRGLLKHVDKKEEEQVAVKTIKSPSGQCSDRDIHNFMEEALRMKDFSHVNVLKLIGIAIEADGGMPLVVLPFMEHGDLLSYLRDDRNKPSVKILLDFGLDIAHGMDYLANLKFVHRDLAARNCMLNEELQVLVADFGLSRDIYEKQYYSASDKEAKLPIKWMAPESLEKSTYNVRSDVWSYGVVLWELMTRGGQPYPGVDNWDVTRYLASGRRMDQPQYCPNCVYEIMLRCWHLDPYARPTFAEIARTLTTKMKEADTAHSQMHDELYANVPNTQGYVERASSGASAFPPPPQRSSARQPQDGADYLVAVGSNNEPVQGSAEDYLTPSEHYYPQDDVTSQYLTSPTKDAEKERLLSASSNNEAVEHGEDLF